MEKFEKGQKRRQLYEVSINRQFFEILLDRHNENRKSTHLMDYRLIIMSKFQSFLQFNHMWHVIIMRKYKIIILGYRQ